MIEIADADPSWPAAFALEAKRLAPLGLKVVEHVGSTAVPGLPAKPVIDVMAVVDPWERVGALLPALASWGHAPVDTGMSGRLFLPAPRGASGLPVNLHLVPPEGWDRRKERLFRDALTAHPPLVAEYGALKRAIAATTGDDVDAYTRAKTAFVQRVMDAVHDARGWPRADVWET